MAKTRFTELTGLLLVLAWYMSTPLAANAQVLPDPVGAPPSAPPTVIHDHTSFWIYALVAAIAVIATLVVVAALRWARRTATVRRGRPVAA